MQGDFKMTIEAINEMRRQRAGSAIAFAFISRTASVRARWARPTEEGISLSNVINIKAIRKLAYLTLPNRK